MRTRITIKAGFLIAAAAVLHVIESWLPVPIPIPGVKLGLANIVTVVALLWLGRGMAMSIAIGRVLIASLIGGSLMGPSFVMSLAGAITSLFVMDYSFRYGSRYFSVVGVSVIGATFHALSQLFIAALLVSSLSVLWYIPWLMVFAVPTGIVTGVAASFFLHHTAKVTFFDK